MSENATHEQRVNPPTAEAADEALEDTTTEAAADDTNPGVTPSPEKDPEDWVTGDEPMTGPQESYLHTLAQEAGVDVPAGLDKAGASKKIDELQARTGRGGA